MQVFWDVCDEKPHSPFICGPVIKDRSKDRYLVPIMKRRADAVYSDDCFNTFVERLRRGNIPVLAKMPKADRTSGLTVNLNDIAGYVTGAELRDGIVVAEINLLGNQPGAVSVRRLVETASYMDIGIGNLYVKDGSAPRITEFFDFVSIEPVYDPTVVGALNRENVNRDVADAFKVIMSCGTYITGDDCFWVARAKLDMELPVHVYAEIESDEHRFLGMLTPAGGGMMQIGEATLPESKEELRKLISSHAYAYSVQRVGDDLKMTIVPASRYQESKSDV